LGHAKRRWPGAGDRHTHAALPFAHEYAYDGVARGWILELGVAGAFRRGEADGNDDLARLQRRLVHAFEELVRRDLALVGVHGSAQTKYPRWIIGCRITVGDRAADGAHIAHHAVADRRSERRQRRYGLFHL